MFAGFASPDASTEVYATLSDQECSVMFVKTWPLNMDVNPELEYYISKCRQILPFSQMRLKRKSKVWSQSEVSKQSDFDSYKNKGPVLLHGNALANIFTFEKTLSAFLEVKMHRRYNAAEVKLTFARTDVVPRCEFYETKLEESDTFETEDSFGPTLPIRDDLIFFDFSNVCL